MPTQAYKLQMTTPLHVGTKGLGKTETLEYYPSSTFFSALVISWLEMGRDDLIEQFPIDDLTIPPPLQLTSAFPYVGDVLLVPRPMLPMALTTDNENESSHQAALDNDSSELDAKSYKKIRWISTGMFQAMLQPNANIGQLWQEGCLLQGKQVLMTAKEAKQVKDILQPDIDGDYAIWRKTHNSHVTVERLSGASNLHFVGSVYFQPGAGLWCMVKSKEQGWLDDLTTTLYHLADSGIGGRRSAGHGRFSLECMTKSPDLGGQADGEYQVLLSLAAPHKEQLDLLTAPHSRYGLQVVGGFSQSYTYDENRGHSSATIRCPVRMVTEGSVIKTTGQPLGRLLNVRANPQDGGHAIHLYGYGYGIPYQPSLEINK